MTSSRDRWLACIAAALGVSACAREPPAAEPRVAATEVPPSATVSVAPPAATPAATPTASASPMLDASATIADAAIACKRTPTQGGAPYPLSCGKSVEPPHAACGPMDPKSRPTGPPVKVTLGPIVGADSLGDLFNLQSYIAYYACEAIKDATEKAKRPLHGTVSLDLTIAANGDVTRAIASGSGLPNETLREIEKMARSNYPVCEVPDSSFVVVRVPMTFAPR